MAGGGASLGWLVALGAALGAPAAAAADQPSAPPAIPPASVAPFAPTETEATEVPKIECVARHEDAQLTRRQGKLLAARSALLACSRVSCPPAIRGDCVDWLEEVNRSVPSVVVTARERGVDVTDVKVQIDGELAIPRLSGSALEADPGPHRFRFESPRWPAIDRTVLMSEGIRNRPIEVEFAPQLAAAARTPAAPPPLKPLNRSDYAFGAVALAGLVASVSLASVALYERNQLDQSCAPSCTEAETSPPRTKLLIADVALGVAVAALAVGVYRYLARPYPVQSAARPASRLSLTAEAFGAGGGLRVGGAF
jgi:hypothetical protein